MRSVVKLTGKYWQVPACPRASMSFSEYDTLWQVQMFLINEMLRPSGICKTLFETG